MLPVGVLLPLGGRSIGSLEILFLFFPHFFARHRKSVTQTVAAAVEKEAPLMQYGNLPYFFEGIRRT